MDEEKIEFSQIIWASIGIALVLFLGIYFQSIITQIIGVCFLFIGVLSFISNKSKSELIEKFVFVPAAIAGLCILSIFIFHDIVKVSPNGEKIHYYKKCPSIAGHEDVRKVLKIDAYLMGKFSTCQHCKSKKAAKERARKAEEAEYEGDYDYIPGVPSRYQ